MMSDERGARDRRFGSVEGGRASGAASTFDGNHTNDVYSWLIPNELWDPTDYESLQQTIDILMERTIKGHLAWVLFVPGMHL